MVCTLVGISAMGGATGRGSAVLLDAESGSNLRGFAPRDGARPGLPLPPEPKELRCWRPDPVLGLRCFMAARVAEKRPAVTHPGIRIYLTLSSKGRRPARNSLGVTP
jgi:hypothetical protein